MTYGNLMKGKKRRELLTAVSILAAVAALMAMLSLIA